MSIEDMLRKRSKRIDEIIERYIPRKYDNKSLEFTLETPRYSYSPAAINDAISKPIWDLLDRGGKRWRPVLFSLICEALGGDIKRYEDLVVMLEIIHDGSLVSDDVEDDSDLRRGKPCIHKIYGIDIAVNVGSAMYYLPLLVLLRNGKKFGDNLVKIYEHYSQELINIHFGQAMDIVWHNGLGGADSISEKEYLQMCSYKTGTLARLAAKLGAVVAGAPDELVEKMGTLAEAIGIGFQIQDDILNLTATSGKNQFVKDYLGSDISEGKRTLIIIHTLQNAQENDKTRLLEILKKHSKEKKEIEEAIKIIKKHKSIDYARDFARSLLLDAWNDVKDSMKDNQASRDLEAFVKFAVERDY